MPSDDWRKTLWPSLGKVLAAVRVSPGTRVAVDLCCGDGLFTEPLTRVARRVIAIDIDPAMIERARVRLAKANCEFVIGDAYRVRNAVDVRADVIFMANAFHGFAEKRRLARAVATAIRPRGRFVIIDWHRRPRSETTVLGQERGPRTELRMEPADVRGAVESVGFAFWSLVELPPYHFGAVFRRR
jgi:ubiquinone/menaquinone biosynthesis C-methylase UbiE